MPVSWSASMWSDPLGFCPPFQTWPAQPRLGSVVVESHKVKLLGKGAYGIAWAWYWPDAAPSQRVIEWVWAVFSKVWKVKDKESSRTSLSVCRLMTSMPVQYTWLLILDDCYAMKLFKTGWRLWPPTRVIHINLRQKVHSNEVAVSKYETIDSIRR